MRSNQVWTTSCLAVGASASNVDTANEVNLILDGYGSAKLDGDHLDRLRDGGVNICIFRPPRWRGLSKLNNRMLRRILVGDGAVALGGGVAITEVWTGEC